MADNFEKLGLDISATDNASNVLNNINTLLEKIKTNQNAIGGNKTNNNSNNNSKTSQKKDIKSTNNLLDKNILKMGTVIMLARKLAQVASKAINLSAQYVENLNLFAVTMGEDYKESLNWANKVSDSIGLATNEVIRYTGLFKQLGTAIGITDKKADAMSQTLTQLGYDLASFYNISTSSAFEKLQAGIFSGQTKPLRALGLDVTYQTLDNLLKTDKAFAEFGDVSSKALTQDEKAQLRLLVVLRNSTNAYGDMSKTVNTLANQQRVFTASVQNLGIAIGDMFNEPFREALVYVNGFLIAMKNLIRLFYPLKNDVSSAGDAMQQYADDEEEASEAGKGLLSFDKFESLSSGSGQKTITQQISDELDKAMSKYQEYLGGLGDYANEATKIAKKILDFFVKVDENGNFVDWTDNAKKLADMLKIVAGIIVTIISLKIINKIIKAIKTLKLLIAPLNIVIFSIGLLVGYITTLALSWNDLSPLQKAVGIFGAIAAAAMLAAAAIAAFQGSWSLGTAAVAIVGGLVAIAAGFVAFKDKLKFDDVPQFANGGSIDAGQMFIANESGAELVGNFGNKSGAQVANNDMIVTAIQNAAYLGVSQAMQENSSSQETTFEFNLDSRKFAQAIYTPIKKEGQRRGELNG